MTARRWSRSRAAGRWAPLFVGAIVVADGRSSGHAAVPKCDRRFSLIAWRAWRCSTAVCRTRIASLSRRGSLGGRFASAVSSYANPNANAANGPAIPDLPPILVSLLDKPKRKSLDQAAGLCRGLSAQTQQSQAIQTDTRHNWRLGISR
jgi:hypothetical protein